MTALALLAITKLSPTLPIYPWSGRTELAHVVRVFDTPHSRATLFADRESARPGETFHLALRVQLDPGWYTYWANPGDSGSAPQIRWKLPRGWRAGQIEFPKPQRIDSSGIVSFGYKGEAVFLIPVTVSRSAPQGPASIVADASWLVCEEMCLTARSTFSVSITVGASKESSGAAEIVKARSLVPIPGSGDFSATFSEGKYRIRLPEALDRAEGIEFFPLEAAILDHSKPAKVEFEGGRVFLSLSKSPYASGVVRRLRGVLVVPDGIGWADGARAVHVDIPVDISKEESIP